MDELIKRVVRQTEAGVAVADDSGCLKNILFNFMADIHYAKDWYAEGWRYEDIAGAKEGDWFATSYVGREEIEQVKWIAVGEHEVRVNERVYFRYYQTWILHT